MIYQTYKYILTFSISSLVNNSIPFPKKEDENNTITCSVIQFKNRYY